MSEFFRNFAIAMANKTLLSMGKRSVLLIVLLISFHVLFAQQRVKGYVQLEDNKPAVGASISIQGTTQSTITDADGAFEFPDTADDAMLIISCKGYEPMMVSASELAAGNMLVTMKKLPDKVIDHRFAAWGTMGTMMRTGNSNAYPDWALYGGIGVGYQLRYKRFLFTTGVEATTIDHIAPVQYLTVGDYSIYYHEYRISIDGSVRCTSSFTPHLIRLKIPLLVGMEMPWWYWQAGVTVGFYNHIFGDSVRCRFDFDMFHLSNGIIRYIPNGNYWGYITFEPTVEIGFNRTSHRSGINYKVAAFASFTCKELVTYDYYKHYSFDSFDYDGYDAENEHYTCHINHLGVYENPQVINLFMGVKFSIAVGKRE